MKQHDVEQTGSTKLLARLEAEKNALVEELTEAKTHVAELQTSREALITTAEILQAQNNQMTSEPAVTKEVLDKVCSAFPIDLLSKPLQAVVDTELTHIATKAWDDLPDSECCQRDGRKTSGEHAATNTSDIQADIDEVWQTVVKTQAHVNRQVHEVQQDHRFLFGRIEALAVTVVRLQSEQAGFAQQLADTQATPHSIGTHSAEAVAATSCPAAMDNRRNSSPIEDSTKDCEIWVPGDDVPLAVSRECSVDAHAASNAQDAGHGHSKQACLSDDGYCGVAVDPETASISALEKADGSDDWETSF